MGFEKYLGIPFQYGGRDEKGIDCIGLVLLYFHDMGIKIRDPISGCCSDFENICLKEDEDLFEKLHGEEWEKVIGTIQEHDVVTYWMERKGLASHCGIVIPGGRVLHAVHKQGVIATPLAKLANHIVGAYRCRLLQ